MNYLIFMTALGLCFKVWAGHRLRQSWKPSLEMLICFVFLLTCYAQTVLEMYGYYVLKFPENSNLLLLLKLYYAINIAILTALPAISSFICDIKYRRTITTICGSVITLFLVLLFETDRVITGVSNTGYALTRIPGDLYWIYQVISLGSVVTTLLLCLFGYFRCPNEIDRIRSMNLFIGFTPFAASNFIIIIAMHFGMNINAAGIFPLLLAFYIFILYENVRQENILDLQSFIPWTRKARTIREISKPFRQVDLSPTNSKQLSKKYEKKLIEHAVTMFEDRKRAATWLDVSQAKISKSIGKRRSDGTPRKHEMEAYGLEKPD